MRLHDPRVLSAFVAALGPLGMLSTGCSSLGPFDGDVCLEGGQLITELSIEGDADHLAMRQRFFDDTQTTRVVASWGEACGRAADEQACLAALEALDIEPALRTDQDFLRMDYDVVFSAGDEVGKMSTTAELLAQLGTIDTASEAALVAFAAGHSVGCEENVRQEGANFVLKGVRGGGCGEGNDVVEFEVIVSPDGTVTLGEEDTVKKGDPNCAIGRRPDGLCSRTHKAQSAGAFFAHAAHLEAASVFAFGDLARELAAHGAPAGLVHAAWRARAEEIRHARITARLARRFGAAPVRPVVGEPAVRSLFAVALDNATEGCVRETFGAVVAQAQAHRARRAFVRRAMREIAADELRHAHFSWALDRWVRGRLSASEGRRLDEAQRAAAAHLRRETEDAWSREVVAEAGVPDAETGLRLLRPVAARLWAA